MAVLTYLLLKQEAFSLHHCSEPCYTTYDSQRWCYEGGGGFDRNVSIYTDTATYIHELTTSKTLCNKSMELLFQLRGIISLQIINLWLMIYTVLTIRPAITNISISLSI